MYFGNRAAALMAKGDHQGAIQDCSYALAVDSGYVRALARRWAGLEGRVLMSACCQAAPRVDGCRLAPPQSVLLRAFGGGIARAGGLEARGRPGRGESGR